MNITSALVSFIVLAGTTLSVATASADPLAYNDTDFGCTPQTQADQYIRDFSVNTESFGGEELCNSQVDTKKLLNDLDIIENGKFDATKSNLLIKGIIPADEYYTWMKSQTRGMDRGNDVPYATAYNSMGYFTMQDGWAASSTLARVGTVIHEARHTAGYRHYPCTHGPYMNIRVDGCDQDYAQTGSHAVEMEYYARVSVAGQNFHPVYKAMARLMAMGRTNFVFNASPIVAHEALVAMDDKAQAPVLFDAGKKLLREGTDFVGHLKRTSFGVALFNGLQAVALDMYELTGARAHVQDDYSYFKLLKMKPLGTLKDMEEFDKNQKRYVAYITGDNQVATYNFGQGTWSPAVATNVDVSRTVTTLPSGEQGYFLIAKSGEVQSLDPETKQVTSTGKTWDAQVIQAAVISGKTMVLKTDGAIYTKAADGQEAVFDQGPYSEMISIPLYDAFEVK
jgi:hypothetical protein